MLADSMATTISFSDANLAPEDRDGDLSMCTTSSEYLAAISALNNDPSPDIMLLDAFRTYASRFCTLFSISAG